jgi:phenylacetate-coenzyme A ligase PaaK-like adenylate-forming protein
MADPEEVKARQLSSLRALLSLAAGKSAFYRRLWAGFFNKCGSGASDASLIRLPASFEEFSAWPFTWPEDLQSDWTVFLCLGLGKVERMVSLPGRDVILESSGSTGNPKRLAFSAGDLENTVRYFSLTMGRLVKEGDRVLILLPAADRPASVSGLLGTALSRLKAACAAASWPVRPQAFSEEFLRFRPTQLVAAPAQLRVLHEHKPLRSILRGNIKNILSCTESMDETLKEALAQSWETEIFEYYASTESGYCGGIECPAHAGYHLDEADFYFEVVDPLSGGSLPEGVAGEVVMTTLKREAMPLVRYRTGDHAAMLPGPCPCGSRMRRLGRIRGRIRRLQGGFDVVNVRKGGYRARYTGDSL